MTSQESAAPTASSSSSSVAATVAVASRAALVEDQDTCSLQDVLDSEKERIEIASAVLGASDPNNCSYDQGYVYRQALYCCLTCQSSSVGGGANADLHGICLACSYECHKDHELYELYTKRYFRCDCGNSKFAGKRSPCKLRPNKEATNELNKYNHNFRGLYCVCDKPYPDMAKSNTSSTSINNKDTNKETDEDFNDEMVQCAVCEDWFHHGHLKGSEHFPSDEDEYDEIVCAACMDKNDFLWHYRCKKSGAAATTCKRQKLDDGEANDDKEASSVNVTSVAADDDATATNGEDTPCFIKKLQKLNSGEAKESNQACCFAENWRDALCRCTDCMQLYKTNGVEFLLAKNDTIKYYEECGKAREAETPSIDENKLMNDTLAQLGRVSQLEFLHNLNEFKTEVYSCTV